MYWWVGGCTLEWMLAGLDGCVGRWIAERMDGYAGNVPNFKLQGEAIQSILNSYNLKHLLGNAHLEAFLRGTRNFTTQFSMAVLQQYGRCAQ